MDLRLLVAVPSDAERAAVDGCLGSLRERRPAPVNGTHPPTDLDGRVEHGGHDARDQRHLLLPVLQEVQARIGWISDGALNYVCERLTVPPADAYGVATFYGLLSVEPRPARVLHVCDDIACRCHGAEEMIAELEQRFGPEDVERDGATWLRSPCLGQCDHGRAAMLTEAGEEPVERVLAPVDLDGALAALNGEAAATQIRTTRPPAGLARAAAAASRRRGRSAQPARLPRKRRLRRAAPRVRAGPQRRDPRGQGLAAARSRWRRIPDRRQMGGRGAAARPPSLSRLQRRRVRARDVQGPRRARGRPVFGDRGDDDRGLRHQLRPRLPVPARRVPARAGTARGSARHRPPARLPGREHPGPGVLVRHRDPARRRRVHLR